MRTNGEKTIIEKRLAKIPISKLSHQCGFIKREPRKIKPKEFILAFIQTISSSKNTYSKWANQLGILINDTVSKQAISKRIKEPLVILFQLILKRIFEETIQSKSKEKVSKELKQFKRILLRERISDFKVRKFSTEQSIFLLSRSSGNLRHYYPNIFLYCQ